MRPAFLLPPSHAAPYLCPNEVRPSHTCSARSSLSDPDPLLTPLNFCHVSCVPLPPPRSIVLLVANLLLWDDVLSSSLALVSGVLLVFLVQVCGYSLLTLTCYVLMLQLLICLIYVNGTKFFLQHATASLSTSSASSTPSSAPSSSSALPPPPPLSFDADVSDYPYFDQDLVLTYSGHIADTLNTLTQYLSHLLHCTNTLHSLQALSVLTALSTVGRLFDGLTLLGAVWVAVFTLPKGYLLYREQVDEVVGRWKGRVDEVMARVRKYMPGERGGSDGKDKVE